MTFDSPYQGYAYSYPHKTAYRPFSPPLDLQELWQNEPKDALFLYLHLPFCEMRCGFCNLFTTPNPKQNLITKYLDTLQYQAEIVQKAIGNVNIAKMAIGGGTPTFLELNELEIILNLAEQFGAKLTAIPISVETSPRTAEPEKLALLRERGVKRISIGVQSFLENEVQTTGRAQKNSWVRTALQNIRNAKFPILNIDLIYGITGQTVETWLQSLHCALEFAPEELYLYPLYVRPLTGLGRSQKSWDDIRLECYRAGRAFLLSNGYQQISMRMFQMPTKVPTQNAYSCQEDGMIGLGCGARSYTQNVHYSTEYAVGKTGVLTILKNYVNRSQQDFAKIDYGFLLDLEEKRRRYVIKSLLHHTGLDVNRYQQRFGTSVFDDFPEIVGWLGDLVTFSNQQLQLTEMGVEFSDAIGPVLYSQQVQKLIAEYELR